MKPTTIIGGITSNGKPLIQKEWENQQVSQKQKRETNVREIAQAQRGVGVEILPPCKKHEPLFIY